MTRSPVIFIFFAALIFSACRRADITSAAPDEAPAQEFRRKPSVINVPVSFSIRQLESRLNAELGSLLYKDDDLRGDNVKMTITKNGNISVTAENNKVAFNIPIHVWALGSWEWQACAICPKLSKSETTSFDMDIKVQTALALTPDWQVQTTSVGDYDWGIRKPYISVGPLNIPLAGVVDLALRPQVGRLAALLDKEIQNRINIKQYVQKAWTEVQQPVELDRATGSWLVITPQEVRVTPLQMRGGEVSMKVGIKSFLEVVSGQKPAVTVNNTLPGLITEPHLADDFQLGLIGEISYEQAALLMKKEVLGRTYTFEENKYQLTIKDLALSSTGDKLLVRLDVDGRSGKKKVAGRIFLEGIPYYDMAGQSIRVRDFDFNLKTRNVLLKSASWLANVGFQDRIQEQLVFPLGEHIAHTQKAVQESLSSTIRLGPHVALKGNVTALQPEGIYLTPASMKAVVNAQGRLTAVVDKL